MEKLGLDRWTLLHPKKQTGGPERVKAVWLVSRNLVQSTFLNTMPTPVSTSASHTEMWPWRIFSECSTFILNTEYRKSFSKQKNQFLFSPVDWIEICPDKIRLMTTPSSTWGILYSQFLWPKIIFGKQTFKWEVFLCGGYKEWENATYNVERYILRMYNNRFKVIWGR